MSAGSYKVAISKYMLRKKIPPGSEFWPTFNASFYNRVIEPDNLMQAIYNGQSITTWHKDHWRKSNNYVCGQHLGLDFDAGDASSRMETLLKDKFILKYAAFIHSTISHTDEAPRSRVIFLLDTPIMQPKNYVLASTALLWLYGTADRSCKDCVRLFFGSPGCQFEYINNVLPLEVIQGIIKNYLETGANERRKNSRGEYRAPASQREVSEALKLIPPWGIDYDEWVQVLMAIHSEFGEDGFQLAENWGDGHPGEIDRKWKSFHGDGNVQGKVTIATLFEIAKRYGWRRNNQFSITGDVN